MPVQATPSLAVWEAARAGQAKQEVKKKPPYSILGAVNRTYMGRCYKFAYPEPKGGLMPLERVAEIKAASAASLASLDALIAEIERSLDVIEGRLKNCTLLRKALAVRERQRRALQ
jgi:hypothetical protein